MTKDRRRFTGRLRFILYEANTPREWRTLQQEVSVTEYSENVIKEYTCWEDVQQIDERDLEPKDY